MNKSEYHKQWYQRNKEQEKARTKRWRENNKEHNRNYHLKRNYGLTVGQYEAMFEDQKGCCAICKKHQSQLKERLCVDHNHKNNEIRNLTCAKCNKALGLFDDNKELLISAVLYLHKFENN